MSGIGPSGMPRVNPGITAFVWYVIPEKEKHRRNTAGGLAFFHKME